MLVVKLPLWPTQSGEVRSYKLLLWEASIVIILMFIGEGALGCGIGYGYLHRIPVKANYMEDSSVAKLNEAFSALSSETKQVRKSA